MPAAVRYAKLPPTLRPCDRQPQPVDIKGWNVYAVDAHSLIFQVFHALPEMSSPRGEQVGAVFGFVRDMLYLIEEKKPDALICAFDLSGPTFRDELFDEYKADRGEMPDELVGQIPKIERVLAALGIPILTCEGYEADDVLATLARICDEAGANCFIVTGDKDCRQLITDRVAVYNIRKNQVFDAAALRDEWGVGPDQVVDFQALVGDKVDNVPGVRRHRPENGPAAARNVRHARQPAGTRQRSARREGQKARRVPRASRCCRGSSCDSTTKCRSCPIGTPAASAGSIMPQLLELFAEFGFRTFAERVDETCTRPEAATSAETAAEADYQLVETPEQLAELVAELSQTNDNQRRHGNDARVAALCRDRRLLVFASRRTQAYYVPVRGPAGEPQLDPEQTLEALAARARKPATFARSARISSTT